jgi:hypothetical protein
MHHGGNMNMTVLRLLTVSIAASFLAYAQSTPFAAGAPLETRPNTTVVGSFAFAESCSYDQDRDLYVVPSAGALNGEDNDGYVSLVNPDGSVHTLKWIGESRDGLTLNQPFGSDIIGGRLYLADLNTVRWFDMETGEPQGSVTVEDAVSFNDLEVADDGTIYASQTGSSEDDIPQRVYKITPDGTSSIFVDGAPLALPNGVAFDNEGNIVVVNIGSSEILTFSAAGELLETQQSLDSVNDGLVILTDGTKYVSSVGEGTLAVIRPGQEAELVASGIPSAASICYDTVRNQIIVPMNSGNAIALVVLE